MKIGKQMTMDLLAEFLIVQLEEIDPFHHLNFKKKHVISLNFDTQII
jgi:hypothetical protein